MLKNTRKWLVVYTNPRSEKKVSVMLTQKGIENYCPLNKVKKKWSDRMKWVEEPLFKSYVFVKVTEEEQAAVRMIRGVVNYVYWLGKPAVVKGKEIEIIRKFLNEYEDVMALPLALQTDDKVIITKGVFMDKEAKVLKVMNNKVQVVIESIGYSLVALVNKTSLTNRK